MNKRQMKKQADRVLRNMAINVINKYQEDQKVVLNKNTKIILIKSAVKRFKTEGHLILSDKYNRKIFDNGKGKNNEANVFG